MRREPDFEQLLNVLWRRERPAYLPLYEHHASPTFIARRTNTCFDRMRFGDKAFWKTYVDFWIGLGFDCVPIEIGFNCPLPPAPRSRFGHRPEAHPIILTWEHFDRYPWPDETRPASIEHFEIAARFLPRGAKLVAGIASGPFEWVSMMMGNQGLARAVASDSHLASAMFERFGHMYANANRQIAAMDFVGALRQGDDLGDQAGLLLPIDELRRYVLPIYQKQVAIAHQAKKPFILHSCGNLASLYDDLIACGIDAKHSFEDTILPVDQFKQQYGQRITPVGGIDMDVLINGTPDSVRDYVRQKIETCFADGFYALGTGKSLAGNMPMENYLALLEEGMNLAG